MSDVLTLGSLFSGAGTFELAGRLAGIKPVWLSEVEPFPLRVTEKRLPDVKQYGDVSKLSGAELPPVDIITFGFPCTDISIAGKQEGLHAARSGLFFQAIRIIKEMREETHGEYPKYAIAENVKALFSSFKGEDFREVLTEFCRIKDECAYVPMPAKWSHAGLIMGNDFSIAWRLFDSKHWGVPQRRERVYIVANFTGRGAGEILFKRDCMPWHTPEGFRTREEAASCFRDGFKAAGGEAIGVDGYNGAVSDMASTLGVNCGMSTGRNGVMVLNDQGGREMSVTEGVTGTIRAQEHGHQPAVLEAAGFCTEHSAAARGIGFEEEKSPTIRAGAVPAAIALEHHPNDGRVGIEKGDAIQSLTGRMGTGGGNVPIIMENPKTYDVRLTSEGTKNWRANIYPTDTARTLDTGGNAPDSNQGGVAVCESASPRAFGICSKTSHGMLGDNPNVGFYEAKTSRCLDQGSGSPTRNQGGMVVVEGNGQRPSHKGDGYKESETMYTLNATEMHAVAFEAPLAAMEEPAGQKQEGSPAGKPYHSSKASYFMNFNNGDAAETLVATDYKDPPTVTVYHSNHASGMNADFKDKESMNTLAASDYKDPPTVCEEPYYIVRRLTPVECARLQGMPDWWCDGLSDDNPSDEEIDKWMGIFEEYRKTITHAKNPKTRKQVIKWLKDPYSDAAAYKMWGNGISLPIPFFILSNIVYHAQNDPKTLGT